MSTFGIALAGVFAGWLLRYLTAPKECEACWVKRMQRQEWDRTAHLDPGWNVLPHDPCQAPMPPVKPTMGKRPSPNSNDEAVA